jgi:hypothetical protein
MDKVRVDIEIPGQGKEAHEYEYCPLTERGNGGCCPIGGGTCKFGLTEISPPATCPLKAGTVKMQFSIKK